MNQHEGTLSEGASTSGILFYESMHHFQHIVSHITPNTFSLDNQYRFLNNEIIYWSQDVVLGETQRKKKYSLCRLKTPCHMELQLDDSNSFDYQEMFISISESL